jgi:hypothetical protein
MPASSGVSMTMVLPHTVDGSVMMGIEDVSTCCLMAAFSGVSMTTAPCNETIPSTKAVHDPPTSLAAASCHVYRSKKGNSSRRTRSVAQAAQERSIAKRGKSGKKERSRQNLKMKKVKRLPTVRLEDHREGELESVMHNGNKVYFAGSSIDLLPRHLPYDSIRRCVTTDLRPYLNASGLGGRAADYYTLLPREWIKKCFPSTNICGARY